MRLFCIFDRYVLEMNSKILYEVSKHHKQWVAFIAKLGAGHYAEDLVQELYLLLNKYGKEEKVLMTDNINFPYVYKSLLNIFLQYKKQSDKIQKVGIESIILTLVDEDNIEFVDAQTEIYKRVKQQIACLEEYEQHLINIHIKHGKSYREIQEHTGINKDYLCSEMKLIRKRFVELFGEDYQDLINGDYHLI